MVPSGIYLVFLKKRATKRWKSLPSAEERCFGKGKNVNFRRWLSGMLTWLKDSSQTRLETSMLLVVYGRCCYSSGWLRFLLPEFYLVSSELFEMRHGGIVTAFPSSASLLLCVHSLVLFGYLAKFGQHKCPVAAALCGTGTQEEVALSFSNAKLRLANFMWNLSMKFRVHFKVKLEVPWQTVCQRDSDEDRKRWYIEHSKIFFDVSFWGPPGVHLDLEEAG